jgi:pyruvate dehydrogenase E2 component (dihydrolipoamide acetyltransferase)
MPVEVTMPQLSDTMTEGTVVKWLKKEGDKIKAGEVVAEVETDKATMEMESFEGGTLAHIAAPEGTKVNVGQTIAFLATKNEKVEDVKKIVASSATPANKPLAVSRTPAAAGATPASADQVPASAHAAVAPAPVGALTAAPHRAKVENSLDQGTATFHGASLGEMHEPDDVHQHGATREDIDTAPPKGEKNNGDGRIKVSPLARRIAAEHGIDVAQLEGSGPGGRIVKQDVLDAVEQGGGQAVATPQRAEVRPLKPDEPAQVPVLAQRMSAGAVETIPLSKMRGVIAKRLQQSKQQIPHFYETVDIDVEELTKLRARLNEQFATQKIKLSLGDLIAKAIATALEEHPSLNAHFNGSEITRYGDVNLGMAVALPEGLIVPVLRGVNHMGFREIRVRSADLVERARAQKLKQDELSGATFTVSNLGMFGVREFSAIINPPEVAILAVGGAEKRAVVRNDQIVARTMMTVTLSADHRAVDGATAAEFLGTLRQLLEEPAMMLA